LTVEDSKCLSNIRYSVKYSDLKGDKPKLEEIKCIPNKL